MIKKYLVLILCFSFQQLESAEKSEILLAMDNYNEAFILADYNQIIENFTFPVSLITSEKVFSIDTKFGLGFVYKKIRGDLPDYYSYSKWEKIDIQLIDDKIAIVNANFSRYNNDDTIFYSGAAQYHLRFKNGEWKIFSLTPYTDSEILD